MDLSLQQCQFLSMKFIHRSFNPCFNGSFTSTKNTLGWEPLDQDVSILVLMDLSLQQYETYNHRVYIKNVSILVLMDLSLQPEIFGCSKVFGDTVSILVLMDLSLQRKKPLITFPSSSCFNPCFNGSFTSTNLTSSVLFVSLMFQSLF